MAKLNDTLESSLRRLNDTHREKIALLDRQFLQQKQQYGVFSSLRRTLGGLRTVKNGSLKRYTELIHNLYCLAIIGNILVALQ